MLFNSLTFLVFFAVVMAVHRLPLSWATRKGNLLLASYVFYAAWNPPFVALLWISTLTDWYAARGIERARGQGSRRAFVLLSLAVNLGLLGYFKYAGFVLDNLVAALGVLGVTYQPPELDIILPIGISFYTFQTLSYSIDVYRGHMRTSRSFLDYALYVTFFPQLVAGPIVRAREFLPQCLEPRRADARQMGWGLALLALGLFQKIVLADAIIAPTTDLLFGDPGSVSAPDAWIAAFGFATQIFFDFAGYSSCAIGVGACLGFSLPENFRFPFASAGFSDLWQRWHISLSSWLRDFVYISLGGNRVKEARAYLNLLLTMLIGGLWHGAAWTYLVWGGLHGVYLVLERLLIGDRRRTEPRRRSLRALVMLGTFVVWSLTLVVFRSASLGDAATLISAAFVGGTGLGVEPTSALLVSLVVFVTVGCHWWLRDVDFQTWAEGLPVWVRGASLAVMLFSILMAPGDDRAFIYFQF